MRKPLFSFLVMVSLFLILACQGSEEERILQVLDRRGEALQQKNLSLYLSCISKTYQDGSEDFGRLQARMERYFQTFDEITYDSWDRSIDVEGETARVVQQFHLEVAKESKRRRFSGKESFLLRKEDKEWKIVKGLSN
jgi:hypothetical protein